MSRDDGRVFTEPPFSDRQRQRGVQVTPDPKPSPNSRPKARGRKRATQREWAALHASKQGPCRGCGMPPPNHLHHVIYRAQGGPDTFDNLIPLCFVCHELVHERHSGTLRRVAESLADGEYSFLVTSLGENALERTFGVTYERSTP